MAQKIETLSSAISNINNGKSRVVSNAIFLLLPTSDNLKLSDFALVDSVRDDLISTKKVLSMRSLVHVLGADAAHYSRGHRPALRSDASQEYQFLLVKTLSKIKLGACGLSSEKLAEYIASAINALAIEKTMQAAKLAEDKRLALADAAIKEEESKRMAEEESKRMAEETQRAQASKLALEKESANFKRIMGMRENLMLDSINLAQEMAHDSEAQASKLALEMAEVERKTAISVFLEMANKLGVKLSQAQKKSLAA